VPYHGAVLPRPASPRILALEGTAVHLRAVAGVDLWWIDLDSPVPAAATLLSDAEQARASRFAFERDRARFVVGRAALRAILSAHVGMPAEALAFRLGPHGKPSLPGGPPFSFSNSHGRGLCAVGGDRELGVDLERLRDVADAAGIARSVFTAEEREAWRMAGGDGAGAFLRVWTRKEAVLKALGVGLAGAEDRRDASDLRRIEVLDLYVDPGYAAALAIVHPT
jgi:4'-phosphopantetheinyl transferase